jgi:hypothetical protein
MRGNSRNDTSLDFMGKDVEVTTTFEACTSYLSSPLLRGISVG